MCTRVQFRLVIRIGPGTLDDLFHGLFYQVPVRCIDTDHLNLVVVLDVLEHLPARLVVNEADGYTDSSKSAGTAYSVEIGLRVWDAATVVWDILMRS